MYIEIENSIGKLLEKNELEKDSKLVENIIGLLSLSVHSGKSGRHCINTESEDCAYKIFKFGEKKHRTEIACFYRYIYDNYSTYLTSLKSSVDEIVLITTEVSGVERKEKGEKISIYVGIETASNMNFWDNPLFLPENIVDCRYFVRIACYLKQKERLYDKIKFCFDPGQGAGGRTIDTFVRNCKENKFIFAILDNDVDSPAFAIRDHSTAKSFMDFDKSPYPKAEYRILNVHEMENLFSSDVFMCYVDRRKGERIKELVKKDKDVMIYYNMKEGYSYGTIESNNYIRKVIPSKYIKCCSKHTTDSKCKNARKCQIEVSPGFGKHYMTQLFGTDEMEDLKKIEDVVRQEFSEKFKEAPEHLNPKIYLEWGKIYKSFLTFFCSYAVDAIGA